MMFETLKRLPVDGKIWFEGETQGYTVQARSERFFICTKPFNALHTVLYTIIDMERCVRGTDNMVFHCSYETREACEENLSRLEDPESLMGLSLHNYVVLRITKLRQPKCSLSVN